MDLTKLKASDEAAWDEAAEELLPFAKTVVRWFASGLSEIEQIEVAEDAFLELIKKIETITSADKLRSWLFTCAKYRAIDKVKKLGRKKNFLSRSDTLSANEDEEEDKGVEDENEDPPDEAAQQSQLAALAAGILESLEAGKAELLRLYYLLGWSQSEIGKKYGWETGSVGNRINQALKHARDLLSSDSRFIGITASDL